MIVGNGDHIQHGVTGVALRLHAVSEASQGGANATESGDWVRNIPRGKRCCLRIRRLIEGSPKTDGLLGNAPKLILKGAEIE